MNVAVPLERKISDNNNNPNALVLPFSIKMLGNQVYKIESLFLETLSGLLPNTKFEVQGERSAYGSEKVYSGLLSDRNAYYHALSLAISSSNSLLLSRQDIAEKVIIPLARKIHQQFHSQGRVHTDIKPSNILFLGEGGPKPIDTRGCKEGSIAATYTPNWCSPEQILGKPVTASSDVYSLATLALKLVDGQISGEVRTFLMPGSPNPITVLATEGVWIDSDTPLKEESRMAWRAALQDFLSFVPEKRPVNGEEFANKFEQLLHDHPITSFKPFRVSVQSGARFGLIRLNSVSTSIVDKLHDEKLTHPIDTVPAWIYEDNY